MSTSCSLLPLLLLQLENRIGHSVKRSEDLASVTMHHLCVLLHALPARCPFLAASDHFSFPKDVGTCQPKKAEPTTQNPSLLLLATFLSRAEHVPGFFDDLCMPCTTTPAERDLPMHPPFTTRFQAPSPEGTSAFCTIRSYLSTMRKQARPLLEALRAVFAGSPFPIAWQPRT